MRIRADNTGSEQYISLVDPDAALLSDQDVIIAQSRGDAPRRVVEVTGAVRSAGPVPLDEARTVAALLGDGANIAADTYPLMGLIERTNPKTLAKDYVPFEPAAAVAGKESTPLHEGDKVKLFSDNEVTRLTATPASLTTSKTAIFDSGTGQDAAQDAETPTQRVLQDHVVTPRGEVARPGNYPIAQDTHLSDIIGAAGGLTHNADRSSVEVVSVHTDDMGRREPTRDSYDITQENPSAILIPVGASVRINPKTELVERQGVRISGEVARPGKYDIMRGEKFSSLIARAGGLTTKPMRPARCSCARPRRRQEAAQFRTAADQLEESIARSMTNEKNPITIR